MNIKIRKKTKDLVIKDIDYFKISIPLKYIMKYIIHLFS